MFKFLFTLLVVYFVVKMARTILFGPPRPPVQPPRNPGSGGRLDQIQDAEFTEIDSK